ncbi:unnamed protein product [Withania somnifera]
MSGRAKDSDSDPPEELTSVQGIQKDEEIRKVERENKARVVQERKERRRQWAQKLTPQPMHDESIEDTKEPENAQDSENRGMLPDEIVKILAAREKSGPVILKDLPPPPCLENSLEFLKKRKMQVSRSSAVLINSSQALRLLSTSGSLRNK